MTTGSDGRGFDSSAYIDEQTRLLAERVRNFAGGKLYLEIGVSSGLFFTSLKNEWPGIRKFVCNSRQFLKVHVNCQFGRMNVMMS
jgi:hypothetical protein